MLAAFEIDFPVMLLMPAANVARRQPAVAVATARLSLRFQQTPVRRKFRDLVERRRLFETLDWREWTIIF